MGDEGKTKEGLATGYMLRGRNRKQKLETCCSGMIKRYSTHSTDAKSEILFGDQTIIVRVKSGETVFEIGNACGLVSEKYKSNEEGR
jgi:hypothetical protein